MVKTNAELANAIIRVGDGRGFIVESRRGERIVITAAHCLPQLPPAHAFSYIEERTYCVLGPRDETPSIYAECWYVDPVSDLAVLGPPDGQALYDECEAYERFVENRPV